MLKTFVSLLNIFNISYNHQNLPRDFTIGALMNSIKLIAEIDEPYGHMNLAKKWLMQQFMAQILLNFRLRSVKKNQVMGFDGRLGYIKKLN